MSDCCSSVQSRKPIYSSRFRAAACSTREGIFLEAFKVWLAKEGEDRSFWDPFLCLGHLSFS